MKSSLRHIERHKHKHKNIVEAYKPRAEQKTKQRKILVVLSSQVILCFRCFCLCLCHLCEPCYNEVNTRKKKNCYNCGGVFPLEGGRTKYPAWGKTCLLCEKYNNFAKCLLLHLNSRWHNGLLL